MDNQLKKEKAKKFTVKDKDTFSKLLVLNNQVFKSKKNNRTRSRVNFALKTKQDYDYLLRKRKKSAPLFGNERKKQKEIEINESMMKRTVFNYLSTKKIEESTTLKFRNKMKIPFKIDTMIGFSKSRVKFAFNFPSFILKNT